MQVQIRVIQIIEKINMAMNYVCYLEFVIFFYLYKLNLKLYVCKVAYHIQILSSILLIFLLHDLCSGDPNSSLPT